MEHTKEPWRTCIDSRQCPAVRNDGGIICFTPSISYYGDAGRSLKEEAEAEGNARRIVACVNALEGIPTEELEKAGTGLMTDAAFIVGKLTKQRDELLAALKQAEASICRLCRVINPQHKSCSSCDEIEEYRAAIALAEDNMPEAEKAHPDQS